MSSKLEVLSVENLTMTSREIAELTNKNHADVLRDIRLMLSELKVGESIFAGSYLSQQNKELPLFNLPKRETLILVSGYNIELRSRIIDRWLELEQQVAEEKVRVIAREKARLGAPEMTNAIKATLEAKGETPKWYHYSNEHNMLYKAAFGKTCKQLLDEIGEDKNLRDHLTPGQIVLLEELQIANKVLVEGGMEYNERKNVIEQVVLRRALSYMRTEMSTIANT